MNTTQMEIEYRDYVERAADAGAACRSYETFCELLGRWQREYHLAWASNDQARMAELEHALILNA